MREEVLRMDHVTRVVDGSACLTDLSLHLFCGEILGLLCMSDHGEDELVELVQKNLPLHYGFVYFDEQLVNSYRKSPMTRNRAAVIERRGRLVGGLSVMDNLFVLRRGFKKYLISRRTLREQYWRYAGELEIEVSPDTPASALSGYERCAVELLKAVLSGARLVVVRDISNIISTADLARFQALMRRCAARGLSFLYLCAHHEEAFTICDRIMVMEDGQIVLALRRPYTSDEAIWRHSLDFSRPVPLPELTGPRRQPALEFDRVVTENLHGFSMRVLPGECVALLDRSNTILEDIVGLMTGNLRPRSGRLVMGGRPFSGGDGTREQAAGVIQADPTRTMIFEGLTALDNLCFMADRKGKFFWSGHAARTSIAREYASVFGEDIYERDVRRLSRRTLYDLVYYRMHLYRPAVVFCVQPFFGADMYRRRHIIDLLELLRARGIALVLLMVNISDSLSVADRLLVAENGALLHEYDREGFCALSKEEGYDPHRTR